MNKSIFISILLLIKFKIHFKDRYEFLLILISEAIYKLFLIKKLPSQPITKLHLLHCK